jgi:hypothetical protein
VFLFAGCAGQTDTSVNLDNWVGIYIFSEFARGEVGSNHMMSYEINIFPSVDDICFAHIRMDGWMTHIRTLARLEGDHNEIKLIFESRLPLFGKPMLKSDDEEEVLLTFRMRGDELLTEWGSIIPMMLDNNTPGIYFEKR